MNRHSTQKIKGLSLQTIVTKRHPEAGHVIAWTDGSCWPNPGGPGGWGYVLQADGEDIREGFDGESTSTNNRAEMLGVIEALQAIDRLEPAIRRRPVIVRTDSQLVVLCAVGAWRRKANADLWRILDALCAGRTVFYEWWRGHVGTDGNERADRLALRGQRAASGAPSEPAEEHIDPDVERLIRAIAAGD